MACNFYINNIDAYATWGARLVDESFDNLLTPAPKKEPLVYESSDSDGKIVEPSPYKSDKNVTLIFDIECASLSDYLTKFNAFVQAVDNGIIAIKVPVLKTVYNLVAESYLSLLSGTGMRNGKLSVRFNEPNPVNRTAL